VGVRNENFDLMVLIQSVEEVGGEEPSWAEYSGTRLDPMIYVPLAPLIVPVRGLPELRHHWSGMLRSCSIAGRLLIVGCSQKCPRSSVGFQPSLSSLSRSLGLA